MKAEARLAALRRRLAGSPADALVVSAPSDQRWVTGFDAVFDDDPGVACLVTADEALVFADSRYIEAVRCEAADGAWTPVDAAEPTTAAVDAARTGGAHVLALQPSLSWSAYTRLAEAFAGGVTPAKDWVSVLRRVKDADEIARIEEAQAVTDGAFDHLLGYLAPGLTEAEVALELEVFMRRHGAEALAFPSIVASGENSCRPHAGVTRRVLADGDFVKLDFGARVDGYCSDMTRTIVLGSASSRQRSMYEAVLDANETAIAACRPGMEGRELHGVAHKVLERRGLADRFGHGLGHGVGLDIHEGPGVGPRSEDVLAPGMVLTIEPGVYEPGFGGVRIEDLVVVQEGGCRVLTRSTKALTELPGR